MWKRQGASILGRGLAPACRPSAIGPVFDFVCCCGFVRAPCARALGRPESREPHFSSASPPRSAVPSTPRTSLLQGRAPSPPRSALASPPQTSRDPRAPAPAGKIAWCEVNGCHMGGVYAADATGPRRASVAVPCSSVVCATSKWGPGSSCNGRGRVARAVRRVSVSFPIVRDGTQGTNSSRDGSPRC